MGCRRWSPDFAFTSILGPRDIKDIELLEMKGPAEKLLNYHRNHPGFTAILHRAIDQVRDYGRYISYPANHTKIMKQLGYIPTQSRLASQDLQYSSEGIIKMAKGWRCWNVVVRKPRTSRSSLMTRFWRLRQTSQAGSSSQISLSRLYDPGSTKGRGLSAPRKSLKQKKMPGMGSRAPKKR